MRWFTLWFSTAVGLAIVSHLRIGISAQSAEAVIVASGVLGLVNLFIRPLVRLVALPLTILTLGLFGWVINGLMLLAVSWAVPGFSVHGLGAAVVGAIILAVLSGGLHWILRMV
ncbi:MAG: phage holin family protein [Thermaerobacter sp.]|nr:phage holin family protein [Thermaerobacter sp.]